MTAVQTTTDDAPDDSIGGRRRVLLITTALVAALVPWVWWLAGADWLDGAEGVVSPFTMVLVALLFIGFQTFSIDFEFRRESHLFTFIAIPVVVGLVFLPAVVVVALRAFTSAFTFFVILRQSAMKGVTNIVIACVDTAVTATVFVLVVDVPTLGPSSWLPILVAVILGDIASTVLTVLVISCFLGSFAGVNPLDTMLGVACVTADVTVALAIVSLLEQNDPAALLVLLVAAALFLLAREYTKALTRYRAMGRINRFAIDISTAVGSGTVIKGLLDRAADTLHAEQAWLLVERNDVLLSVRSEGDGVDTAEPTELDRLLFAQSIPGARLFATDDRSTPAPIVEALDEAEHVELVASTLTTPDGSRLLLVVADRSGNTRPFDSDDVELARTVSIHAGLSLQNVDLLDQLRTQVAESDYLASHDPLTDLPNRTLLNERLQLALADGRPVAVLLFDLDRFKEVNDTLGHLNGDLVLTEVAQRLNELIGPDETAARLGGDEYALVIRPAGPSSLASVVDSALETGRRIAESLQRPFAIEDVAIDISASIGVAVATDDARDPGTLLRQADVAMYLAKDAHSLIEVYRPERDVYSPHRLALAGRLRSAIEERQLELHFQPQVHLTNERIHGVEALIRWPQADGSFIPPDEFIYLAEHTGLIHGLTEFVITSSIEHAARWHAAGTPLRVSMNVSAYNLGDESVLRLVDELLRRHEVPPHLLVAELTESSVISDAKKGIDVMNQLREIGLGIAIDDFGTGQSSLAYLTQLPATELKIDRSFVTPMATERSALTVVRTTVELAHSLGMEIVAEGVETVPQRDLLREMGAEFAQGYLYSRPLTARGLELWMDAQEAAPADADAAS